LFDDIVRQIRFPDWQNTADGERELHALLKAKDPSEGFGGLVRVMNKRQEFLWVHEKFAGEY